MKLQAVTLQVAGSNPAGASILWPRSSADRAGRFSTPRCHGRMTWRMQRKLHRPRRVQTLQGKSRSHSGSGVSLNTGRHDRGKRPETILVLRKWSCGFEACSVVTSSWRNGGKFPVNWLSKELQRRMPGGTTASTVGWSGRFDSSLAHALWHERDHPVSSTLVAAAKDYPRQMPAGLQVEQPAGFPAGVSDVQIIPRSRRERVAQIILSCHPCCGGLNEWNTRRMPGRTTRKEQPVALRREGRMFESSRLHKAMRSSSQRSCQTRRRDDEEDPGRMPPVTTGAT